MRAFSLGFQGAIATEATTLCWCWRLTRADGLVLGFTDHDRDLVFDGTIFLAASGFTGSEMVARVGLAVDNLDVQSALSADALTEADLIAGLYDDAQVEIFRVDWRAPENRALVRVATIGEVRRSDQAFTAELRGLSHRLNRQMGRLYQYPCDADLGDGRCGVDLANPLYRGAGTVTVVPASHQIAASGLDAFAAGWFDRGLLTWTSGANTGAKAEIKSHDSGESSASLTFWQPPARLVAIGDTFTVTAGCDKGFTTCHEKFANALNYRGFPHIPGNDFVLSYARNGEPGHDGTAIVTEGG